MRATVEALFHDSRWTNDPSYVQRRFESSIMLGAWECAAAARFKNPTVPKRTSYAQPDDTDYRGIACPVLLIGGENDKLKDAGYADRMAAEIPNCQLHLLPQCGHLANIECADVVNSLLLAFLARVNGVSPATA
jgi:pimeloyl-ACP methyl ester carboxylesterase